MDHDCSKVFEFRDSHPSKVEEAVFKNFQFTMLLNFMHVIPHPMTRSIRHSHGIGMARGCALTLELMSGVCFDSRPIRARPRISNAPPIDISFARTAHALCVFPPLDVGLRKLARQSSPRWCVVFLLSMSIFRRYLRDVSVESREGSGSENVCACSREVLKSAKLFSGQTKQVHL